MCTENSKGLNLSPETWNCCEKNCDSCEEEKELVLGKRSAKLPFLNAGGEERTGPRGQSADRGHALEAPTAFFPAPIPPIFP